MMRVPSWATWQAIRNAAIEHAERSVGWRMIEKPGMGTLLIRFRPQGALPPIGRAVHATGFRRITAQQKTPPMRGFARRGRHSRVHCPPGAISTFRLHYESWCPKVNASVPVHPGRGEPPHPSVRWRPRLLLHFLQAIVKLRGRQRVVWTGARMEDSAGEAADERMGIVSVVGRRDVAASFRAGGLFGPAGLGAAGPPGGAAGVGGGRRARSVMVILLSGGLGQHDSFDMKPEAPEGMRGEFRSIDTAVPGIRICEHLPGLAARVDRLAIVRTMAHPEGNHLLATHRVLTGHPSN